MKQIPILFSAAMVQAILAFLKTMTRRLKGLEVLNEWPSSWVHDGSKMHVNEKGQLMFNFWNSNDGRRIEISCPYGKPGDVLWVRENFRVNSWVPDDGEVTFRYEADGKISDYIYIDDDDRFNKYWEQSCSDLADAGYIIDEDENYKDYDYKALRLRPNIFMPKEAARIWLEVTDIRVERLQDITERDVLAEGAGQEVRQMWLFGLDKNGRDEVYRRSFQRLWKSINGAEYWNSNPWVWCVSFRVLSTNGKPHNI
jgi:hypothetical protein